MARRTAQAGLMTALLTLALLWPAIFNGQPFIFTDTSAYVRGFDAAIFRSTGISSDWTSERTVSHALRSPATVSAPARSGRAPIPASGQIAVRDAAPVLSGRSVYYGGLIYLSDLLAGFWPLVLLQATLVAFALIKTLQRLLPLPRSRVTTSAILCCLIMFTPVAYFTDLAMPDVFGGLAILAAASLLFMWPTDDQLSRVGWTTLLTASLLVHSGNMPVTLGMIVVAFLLQALRLAQISGHGFAALVGAVMVSQAGEAAFSIAVQKATGHTPIRPPFVTARLIDDGPGIDYLRRTCPSNGFVVCRYLGRLPLSSDRFLWSVGRSGVFSAVPPADQRRLADEDTRFALSVLMDRPIRVIGSTIISIARQLGEYEMSIFNYPPFRVDGYREKLPADTMADVTRTRAYTQRMPVRYLEIIDLPIAILSLAVIGLWAARNRRSQPQLAGFVALVTVAFLINALVFGALSTPHGRYQNRIIWLLPLLALPLAKGRRSKWPSQKPDDLRPSPDGNGDIRTSLSHLTV